MIGKLFRHKESPKNDGELTSLGIGELSYSKVFELELVNMEGSPVYLLENRLTVGSEIGDILIDDPSVSPRHASFILQDEIISVIDHGSISGTTVNGTKIPSGKYIILEESDVVNVGDLEFRLKTKSEARPVERIPDIPTEDEVPEFEEEMIKEKDILEDEIPEFNPIEQTPKKKFDVTSIFQILKKTNNKKAKSGHRKKLKKVSPEDNLATNSLVRVLAVITDLVLSYSLLVILMPYDDVRNFFEFIPNFISTSLDVDWHNMWEAFKGDYEFLGLMVEDGLTFFTSMFQIGPLLIMFILNRLFFTLLLGVSLSEFMYGVKAKGNGVWLRIGGLLRVLVGVVTWPFLIFDLPSIVSRRTFKELLTFTHTYLDSKFMTIVSFLIYLPLVIVFALLSPLIQGFEPPAPILVDDRIEQRLKVKPSENVVGEEDIQLPIDSSEIFGIELVNNPNEVTIFPGIKFSGAKSKLKYKSRLHFYDQELKRDVGLEVLKTFDLKGLLSIGIRNNPFLYEKYPEIYNFVYSALDSSMFKTKTDLKAQLAFGQEIIQLTKTSFELSTENALSVMEEQTPLLKGLVNYKASFTSLIEYKDFDQVSFMKLGNLLFMKISFMGQRPFDLILPLRKGEGQIFKVTFDKRENLKDLSTKFYKYHLERANWIPEQLNIEKEVMTPMQVFDLLSMIDLKEKLPLSKAQALYAYYFEKSSKVLSRNDQTELNLWKESVSSFIKVINALPDVPAVEGEEDSKAKLQYNFRDLMDALENKNYDYFGIPQTEQI